MSQSEENVLSEDSEKVLKTEQKVEPKVEFVDAFDILLLENATLKKELADSKALSAKKDVEDVMTKIKVKYNLSDSDGIDVQTLKIVRRQSE